MPRNAADRKSVREAEKAARLADRQRQEVIASVMSTTFGRQWLWDLLAELHIFHPNTISDVRLAGIFDGERNAGLRILSDIMAACPDQYIQAMRESNERSSVDERRSSPQPDRGDSGSVDPGSDASPDDYDFFGDTSNDDRDSAGYNGRDH